jgi:hypothetical protein
MAMTPTWDKEALLTDLVNRAFALYGDNLLRV